MSDFVRSCVYESDRTPNRDRGEFSGAPNDYLRGWFIETGKRPRSFMLTEDMMEEAFAVAERNKEDAGVWLPPPIPSPRRPGPMPSGLRWGIVACAIAAGYALRAVM
jgi:hypothetical protein